jgi:[ribosomal protein S5]-alanine N-acetyltransferase
MDDHDSPIHLTTPRLELTLPPPSAAPQVADYFARNVQHFARWNPPTADAAYTAPFWEERLARNRRDVQEGSAVRLYLFARGALDGRVIGSCNFTQIFRGPFLSCNLGYAIDREAEGKGLMFEALRAAIDHAFGPLGLHRIEANYDPVNERSGRLLKRLGFVVEGYARDYLFIGGMWRDHLLTALVNPTPLSPPAPA